MEEPPDPHNPDPPPPPTLVTASVTVPPNTYTSMAPLVMASSGMATAGHPSTDVAMRPTTHVDHVA